MFCFSTVVVRQFQEYTEPDEPTEDRRRSGIKDEDKVLLPLDENVLTDNLGLPMVVVVTKVSENHGPVHFKLCTVHATLLQGTFNTKKFQISS